MKRFHWNPLRFVFAAMSAVIVLIGGPAFGQAPPPADIPKPISFSLDDPAGNPPAVNGNGCVAPNCVARQGCLGPNGCEAGGFLAGGGDGGPSEDAPWTISGAIFDENPPFTIGGYTQLGYTNKSDGVFNTHPGNINLHQNWLYLERVADGSKGIGFGGRVDIIYGVDAANTQAFGNNPGNWDFMSGMDNGIYGWAVPQFYGEIAYKDLSVKFGHFYTLLGYEVVPANGNFFYSHAFTMNFSEAFTHTGVLTTYKVNDKVTVYNGWTAGWDTGFDQFNNGSSYLGGASVQVTDSVNVTYITTVGNLGAIGDGYSHSIVATFDLGNNWEYVFQSDLLDTNAGLTTVGLNNYLFYTVNDQIKIGSRSEWWKLNGTSFYEMTVGVNVKPMNNLVVRPEIRYQWSPGGAGNAFGIPVDQTIFGIDAILTY